MGAELDVKEQVAGAYGRLEAEWRRQEGHVADEMCSVLTCPAGAEPAGALRRLAASNEPCTVRQYW